MFTNDNYTNFNLNVSYLIMLKIQPVKKKKKTNEIKHMGSTYAHQNQNQE